MTTTFLINTLRVISIIIEWSYSFYKKDTTYSTRGAVGNILRGLTNRFIQDSFFFFFFLWVGITSATFSKITILPLLACVLSLDFLGYVLHTFNHRVPLLWVFHSVHHSDDKVNLTTGYRVSWLEQTYSFIVILPILLLIGFNINTIIVSVYIISTHSFLSHINYVQLPKFFSYIIVTPQTHRIHHDENIENQNSNYGNLFSIWDRMFGTFKQTYTPLKFGIKGYHQDNFIKMETDPIITYIKNIIKK